MDDEQPLTPDELADFAQWKAERDEAEFIEDMRVTRPFRVHQTLKGDPSFTLRDAYSDFIELLRSGDPLPQRLRDAIADALVRGQTDQKQCVRLKIEADGTFFNDIRVFEAKERLLDAGLYIARERNRGRRPGEIRQDLPGKFNIVDAEDYEKRAKQIYKKFQAWLEANYQNKDVFDWRPTNDIHSYERVQPTADVIEITGQGVAESDPGAGVEDDFFQEEGDDYFAQARFLYLKAVSPPGLAVAYAAGEWLDDNDDVSSLMNKREDEPR